MSHEEDRVMGPLVALCQRMQITCCVQVGAEDGYEVSRIKEATGCRAVAIEAAPMCAEVPLNIEFHAALIGATDGVQDFYVHPSGGLSSQFPRGGDEGESKVQMEQARLDTFCAQRGIVPDALIIDTEGTTLDVLEGCGDLLANVRLVYAEVQNYVMRPGMRVAGDVNAFLAARGFTHHIGLPSYSVGSQDNQTWVKP